MSKRLPNYIRSLRRRAALSQQDVAYLLGDRTEARVSRYERSRFLPLLREALALEVILGRPVAELFAGIYEDVRKDVRGRALRRLGQSKVPRNDVLRDHRKRSLEAIRGR